MNANYLENPTRGWHKTPGTYQLWKAVDVTVGSFRMRVWPVRAERGVIRYAYAVDRFRNTNGALSDPVEVLSGRADAPTKLSAAKRKASYALWRIESGADPCFQRGAS